MKDDNFKLLKGFAIRQTNKLTNEQTFASVESLSGLKYIKHKLDLMKVFIFWPS